MLSVGMGGCADLHDSTGLELYHDVEPCPVGQAAIQARGVVSEQPHVRGVPAGGIMFPGSGVHWGGPQWQPWII